MIEAMKQALDAFHQIFESTPVYHNDGTCIINDKSVELSNKAIASLQQAIAKLESQEPVAWSCWQSCLNDDGTQTSPWVHRLSKFKPHESIINKDIVPLYTHPPQRTWVGLTDEDKKQMAKEANYHWEMTAGEYAERIGQLTEAKLKQKNGFAEEKI